MSTKKSSLTPRQTEIIRIVAKFTPETPATAADIAKELSISTRTVLREMPPIERWLQENEFQFIRKPGVGLSLVGQLSQLTDLLEGSQPQRGHSYTKEERRHKLLSELLSASEPVKSQSLTHHFQISEGTLVGDLDFARDWFTTYGVTLHRRPGLGIYLESSEPHLRHAMVGVLLEDLQEQLALELLEGNNALLQMGNMSLVVDVLTQVAKSHHLHYTDRGYMALALYLAVSAQRIGQGHPLLVGEGEPSEYPVATAIAQQLHFPQGEIYWIARELISAIQRSEDGQTTDQLDSLPLRQMVLRMIDQVEGQMVCPFGQRQLLVDDLMRHMEPALCRLQLGIPVKNPHIQEIKTQYAPIYEATREACQLLLEPTGAKEIPESEVAFIAMHFCAANQRSQSSQRKIHVVIVCPTGVGMSRILAANLAKHFKQIEIHSVVSVMRLAPDWLNEQAIDLVISTVKLTLAYPNICVHPGLRAQDRVLITEHCQRLAASPPREVGQAEQQFQLRSTVDYLETLGHEMLRLVGRVALRVLPSVENKEALMQAAAALFTQGEFARSVILGDLSAREAISETYIDEGQMLLLHCRTLGVTQAQLGFLRLEQPLMSGEKIITGAIVMLMHQNPSPAHGEMMGQISAAFLENQPLYLAVHQGTEQDFAREVEQVLSGYYRSILKRLAD